MIAGCRRWEYDLIVRKSVSRFARNLVDCISLIRELRNQVPPVGVYFETDKLYTLSEESELKLSIFATFAQEESQKKSESMKKGTQRGRVPFRLLPILKFGCFTFGGGLNIIAQMQRLYVDDEKRISSVELLDLTSVARSLPGLFVGNVAFLYGYRESGYPGAFAALFGMVIPPMIVLGFITYFYTIFHTQATVMAGMTGVRAAVVPIMASALLGLLRGAFPMRACYAVAAAALAAYFFFNVNCVWLIAGGIAAGLLLSRAGKGGGGDGAA